MYLFSDFHKCTLNLGKLRLNFSHSISAFFAPYHMLPIYISLEGRTLSCGQLIWSSYFGGVFRIPERLASPISLTFTIGIAHLLGRLIASK